MEITTINAEALAKAFLAGAKNLEAKKEWINELNVFPVPDGDTGTNMSMTIMSAAKEVAAMAEPDMKSLAKAISSGSLRGARGNSGVILSQILRGFARGIDGAETIDAEIEWEQKHGSQLYGVGADGYIVLASAGLRKENWTNTAARKEYLSGWADELEEEATCLADDFVKYELPNMMKEAAK